MGIEKFPPHALSLMRWLLVEPRFSFGTPLIVYKNVVLETEHDDKNLQNMYFLMGIALHVIFQIHSFCRKFVNQQL
jgi:hypothetical protein